MNGLAVIDPQPVSITPAGLPAAVDPNYLNDQSAIQSIQKDWLSSFSRLILSGGEALVYKTFLGNSYWRDHLCLSWDFRTLHGPAKISSFLSALPKGIRIKAVDIDSTYSDPVQVVPVDFHGDLKGLQLVLTISTDAGSGRGVAKLVRDESDGIWKAFTLYTTLESLTGCEEMLGPRRPNGVAHGESKGRRSWKDTRDTEQECELEGPTVLIIGASPPSTIYTEPWARG